ncbi:alpha/beta hydrolase, partial [Actinoplanes sp. NPDC049681]|uniref:alpha/beta hydrolase n=1 Tax=Actinoplanes sp. NPDC049681 TaxID=3363905 RepID=UPI0037A15C71
LYQYDLQTGVNTLIASGFTNTNYRALGADDTAVWVTTDRTITRWELTGQKTVVTLPLGMLTSGPMTSGGDYLYAITPDNLIVRINKGDAATRLITGDTGTDGLRLTSASGLATDGDALYTASTQGLTRITPTTRVWEPTFRGPKFDTVDLNTISSSTAAASGLAAIGNYVFTTAGNQIIKTNTSTGTSTVLAGTTTSTSCTDADTGAAAQFSSPKVIGADGSAIYVYSCGYVRAVNPANGATTTLTGPPNANVYAISGHQLYAANGSYLYQYDLQTGVNTLLTTNLPYGSNQALAADDSYVWVATDKTLLKVTPSPFAGTPVTGPAGQVTTVSTQFPLALDGIMTSIGNYLYIKAPRPNLTDPLPNGTPQLPDLSAISKTDGSRTSVAVPWGRRIVNPDNTVTLVYGTALGLTYDGNDLYTLSRLDGTTTLLRIRPQAPVNAPAPDDANKWWQELNDTQRNNIINEHPERVGWLDGVPIVDRDKANRLWLLQRKQLLAAWEKQYTDEIAGLEPGHPMIPDLENLLREIDNEQARIEMIEDKLDGLGQGVGFLVGVDTKGDGKVIIADHNPDKARHTAVWVPGLGTTLDSTRSNVNRIKNLRAAASGIVRGEVEVSTIYWLGYDAPELDASVALTFRAQAGAAPLNQFVDALRLTHGPGPYHLTAAAHSYGSTVVGEAALTGNLHADDLLVAGSPGLDTDNIHDLTADPRHVWAGAADDDPVARPEIIADFDYSTKIATIAALVGPWVQLAYVDGHEISPHEPEFGANEYAVDTSGHSAYWDWDDEPSDSVLNQAAVVVGKYSIVRLVHGEAPPNIS